jgi:PPE-repeat protein
MGHSPASLRIAAVVQAAESAVVLVATVLVAVDTAAGQSYHTSSGIALTVIGVAVAAALALVAAGLARARRWSRTPALLTQLFFGIVGIYLLQGHRLDWGVALVVLAAAGFAAVLTPPSMRALVGREEARPEESGSRQAQTGQTPTGQTPTGQTPTGQTPTGQTPTGQTPTGQTEPGQPRPAGGASRRRSARPGAE